MARNALERLAGGLVVSCQAVPGEPLYSVPGIVALAQSAQLGGAHGLRLNGPTHVAAVKAVVDLPIIGLYKIGRGEANVYITPTAEAARQIAAAGADMVAIDATARLAPNGMGPAERIAAAKATGALVMADVATLAEGVAAAKAGADCVSTTLSGYTVETAGKEGPDFTLLAALVQAVDVPVFMEGRIWHPDEVARAFALGAHAVVIGSAITRPHVITARFRAVTPRG